ncbi:MAG TPA: hypothetical protein VFD59_19705 [Nocardioidaceae bacterium]|nr:hypothetical protein [Nocardioidaceae bacterium]
MNRLVVAMTAPLLAVSLLSGCGGDEGSTDDAASAEGSDSASPSPDVPPSDEPDDAAKDAPGAGTKYCDLLSTDFASIFANIQGPEDVAGAIGIIEEIGAEAPSEVKKEWGLLEGAMDQVGGALTEAARLQKQAESGEVDKEELQEQRARLTKRMQSLNTPENAAAGEVVAQHSTDYCGLTLG